MRLSDPSASYYRNERIIALKKMGNTQQQIANLLNCSQGWVSKLLKHYEIYGSVDLSTHQQKRGPKCRLTSSDFEQLKKALKLGALFHGFRTDNWTRKRIASLIIKVFNVTYHPAHISRLMAKIGFSVQKPQKHNYRKDLAEVAEWQEERFPKVKKKLKKKTT